MKRLLVTLLGFFFIGVGVAAILFVTALTGLAATPTTFGYLMMAVLGVGLFGPLVVLGLHCVWFRWVVGPRGDLIAITACGLCALMGTIAVAYTATLGPPSNATGTYYILFFTSAALCSFGIKIGRF